MRRLIGINLDRKNKRTLSDPKSKKGGKMRTNFRLRISKIKSRLKNLDLSRWLYSSKTKSKDRRK